MTGGSQAACALKAPNGVESANRAVLKPIFENCIVFSLENGGNGLHETVGTAKNQRTLFGIRCLLQVSRSTHRLVSGAHGHFRLRRHAWISYGHSLRVG
jgi:hypothetical protein